MFFQGDLPPQKLFIVQTAGHTIAHCVCPSQHTQWHNGLVVPNLWQVLSGFPFSSDSLASCSSSHSGRYSFNMSIYVVSCHRTNRAYFHNGLLCVVYPVRYWVVFVEPILAQYGAEYNCAHHPKGGHKPVTTR